jgi:acetyltransferase-like isoleucine patch superfamily enzyme
MIPAPIASLYFFIKFKALVSVKAEVEVSKHLSIGKGSRISSFCKIKVGHGPLTIGKNAQIAVSCFLSSHTGGLHIGNDVLIGPHVSITASNYGYAELSTPLRLQEHTSKGIRIGDNVWIGANASILDGAIIGNGVIITANSVVGGRIPDNTIVQGDPARVIFTRRA